MEKTIIFDNRRYNWNGKYYNPVGGCINGRTRLHRAVWEKENGKIPKGFHIHHIDGDRTNNRLSNLQIISASEHLSNHFKENWKRKEFREKVRENCDNIRPLTKKWHASKEGIEWHRNHGKEAWVNKKTYKKICEVCGKEYETYFPKLSRFCHNNCKARALRKRRRLQSNS